MPKETVAEIPKLIIEKISESLSFVGIIDRNYKKITGGVFKGYTEKFFKETVEGILDKKGQKIVPKNAEGIVKIFL